MQLGSEDMRFSRAISVAIVAMVPACNVFAERVHEVSCEWFYFDGHLAPAHMADIEKEVVDLPPKIKSRIRSKKPAKAMRVAARRLRKLECNRRQRHSLCRQLNHNQLTPTFFRFLQKCRCVPA